MAAVAGNAGAHVAAVSLMTGGSVLAGVVMATGDGRAAVCTGVACGESRVLRV